MITFFKKLTNKIKEKIMSFWKLGAFSCGSGKIERKNVMDGLLHFSFFVISASIIFIILGIVSNKDFLVYVGIVFFAFIFLIYIVLYSIFAFKDPDRLQTEKYQLEKQYLAVFSKNTNEIENIKLEMTGNNSKTLTVQDIEVEEKEDA